jgi:manganese/zinc/iron transport system substrate-binding protein
MLDFLNHFIRSTKLPFLASFSQNFSTMCSHMLSKFLDKSAQKWLILATKASYARSLLKLMRGFFCYLIGILLICGCSTDHHQKRQAHFKQWIQNNGKVKVLSTTAMVNDIVKQVGGERVDTMTLIEGQLDPHSYQLVKGDDEKLNFAQIIFYSGLGLEHGPSLHHYLIKNPKSISLGDQIDRQNPGVVIYVREQKDPHIWMDISLWSRAIPFIVESLSKQDPEHSTFYQTNGQKLQAEMAKVHLEVKEIMHHVPANKRYLVTSHDAFNYFARAYLSEDEELDSGDWEKRFAAPEGLAPESQLSSTDIKAIIDHLRRYQVHLLFPESNVSRDSIRKIVQAGQAQGIDVKIACCPLYSDAMGQPGSEGDSYLKMILYNARTLSGHMDPKLGERLRHDQHIDETTDDSK